MHPVLLRRIMVLPLSFFLTAAVCTAQKARFIKGKDSSVYLLGIYGIKPSEDVWVSVKDADIAIDGKWIRSKHKKIYKPVFPFEENVWYRVKTNAMDTLMRFSSPKKKPSFVTGIYPLTDSIPENLLRFYIYFNAPMQQGNFPEHIHLYNEQGEDLRNAFFDNQRELWNNNYTRITVLLDPGRVKTGLAANIKMGRVFTAGQQYRLVIDKGWKDIDGNELENSYVKKIISVNAYDQPPDTSNWIVDFPRHPSDTLCIYFGGKTDHVSVQQFIAVADNNKKTVRGKMYLNKDEVSAVFVPEHPWLKGNYTLLVNGRLEDITGNNLNGLLDHKAGTLKNQQEDNFQKIQFVIE